MKDPAEKHAHSMGKAWAGHTAKQEDPLEVAFFRGVCDYISEHELTDICRPRLWKYRATMAVMMVVWIGLIVALVLHVKL